MSLNISGLVGYSILLNKNNNKIIVLLADIHDGVSYCKNNNLYIDELLNKLIDKENIKVLLEEVPRDGVNLIELWPNALHTQRLKDWYIENSDKIEPIDIRPFLVPFSFQKYIMNDIEDSEKKLLIKDYIKTIDGIFGINNKVLHNGLFFVNNLLKGLNDKESDSGISNIYKILKIKYIDLCKEIDLNKTFEEIILKNQDWFYRLEEIKMNLMDWYTTILLLGSKHSICHFGLAHFVNVKNTLSKIFNCELIYENGINSFSQEIMNKKGVLACINLLK